MIYNTKRTMKILTTLFVCQLIGLLSINMSNLYGASQIKLDPMTTNKPSKVSIANPVNNIKKTVLDPAIIKLLDYKQDKVILDGGAKIVDEVIILKGTPKQFVKAMFKLPTSMVGNKPFYVIGDVKMKNVQGGKKHWHSAKFQVNYVLNGKKVYKSKSLIGGDINQWIPLNLKVQIPAGKKIDRFNLLVAMERNSGLFQIRNLGLTRKPYKQTPVFTFPLPEKLSATITINTKQSKKFNNLLLGLNSQFMGWAPAEYNYANSKVMNLVKTIKVPLLRFPGGTVSNYYDWKTDLPILPKDIKLGKGFINKWKQHIANKRQFGFANYAKMVKQFNIESLLVFNIREDSVKSHLDRLQHRIESGIGIAAIELGNENYLKPNYGGFTKNADEYSARCNKVYLELNKQDPNTTFGINITHETGGSKWNNTVMKDNKTGNVFLHPYVAISREWKEQIDWTIMRSILFGYTRLGKMLKTYTDAYPTTPVYLSEWGMLCAPTISKSHIAALATFDALFNIINYAEQGVIKAATLHCFFGGYMGLFSHDNKGAIIRTGGTSIIYDFAIETFLNADLLTSQTKSFMLSKALPAVNSRATINTKGVLKIFAINKTPLPCTYTIDLDGKKYSGQAQIKSYTRKNIIKAENFKLNEKLTTEKMVTGNIVLPPYSANVISIKL